MIDPEEDDLDLGERFAVNRPATSSRSQRVITPNNGHSDANKYPLYERFSESITGNYRPAKWMYRIRL